MPSPLIDRLEEIEVASNLKPYRVEADELRAAPGEVDIDEHVSGLHERLIRSRRAQDRMETLLAELGLIKSRVKMAVVEAQNSYDDQWRNVMERTRIGEYTSAKERDSTYAAGSIEQLIKLRKAQRMLAEVEEVFDYVQLRFRGLDTARREIELRIRIISLESSLER